MKIFSWKIKIEMLYILLLQLLVLELVEGNLSPGTRVVMNKRSVKSRAFNRACVVHNCRNTECISGEGWNIYGSDLGCCGNYDGCCRMASVVCYLHDVMCKCCDYGWLICGPDCQREPECDNKVEADDNQMHVQRGNEDFRNSISQFGKSGFSQETKAFTSENSRKANGSNLTSTKLNNTDVSTVENITDEDVGNVEIQNEKRSEQKEYVVSTSEPTDESEYQKEGFLRHPKHQKSKYKPLFDNEINSIEKQSFHQNMFMSDQPTNEEFDEYGSGEIG